jgi:preprotein translocase subunit SecG
MHTVIIVIHLMVVLSLVAVVLLQRSEGGALGIGGGGGFMSSRGQANALTRATTILAMLFFATSLGLALLARSERGTGGSLFDQPGATAPVGTDGQGLLPLLRGPQGAGGEPAQGELPAGEAAPAAPGGQPTAPQAPATTPPAPQQPAAPQAPVSQ